MPKKALSVTLDGDNLLWLRGRTGSGKHRSLSEVLDRIVTEARLEGRVSAADIRSVVGTVDIDRTDPLLSSADDYIRGLFDDSLRQPRVVRESPVRPPARQPKARRG